MTNRDEHDTAQFINTEPIIFLGCTGHELSSIALIAVFACFPLLSVLALLLSGSYFFALAVGLCGALLGCCIMARLLRHHKHGRPDGHFQLLVLRQLARLGFYRQLLTGNRRWGVGRSLSTTGNQ